MRSLFGAVFAVALGLLAANATHAAAQQTEASFRGTFVRDADAGDSMKKIVDMGMSKLGSAYRIWPISTQARKRLENTNKPYAWIQFVPDAGTTVTTTTDQWKLTTPKNGRLEDWSRDKDDQIDVTTRWQSGRVEHAFDAEDGRRVNVYTLSPDGNTLFMDVTVTSPKLDSPLTYRMVYRRRT